MVSICIPTYNGVQYLDETLQSIQSQTFQNIELIVSDDASQDNTLELVETFKKEVDFPVHIYHHTPKGIGANWNNCIKYATGKYIKFLFQDDLMEPTCIEEMVKALEENPEQVLVVSKRTFIIDKDMDSSTINKWIETYGDLQPELIEEPHQIIDKELFKKMDFPEIPRNKIGEPSVVMFKRELIDTVGYFNEDLKQILDYEYWYRILKYHPIYVINKPLVKFRLHPNQATNVNNSQRIEDYEIYEQILYKQYLKLLHPVVRKRLYLKYHPIPLLKQRIKNKLKRVLK
jgi:glycosyltransferase involved in cell wall biosynthesis